MFMSPLPAGMLVVLAFKEFVFSYNHYSGAAWMGAAPCCFYAGTSFSSVWSLTC